MKDKIMLFVIGVLVGAVISTGAFYIYTTTNCSCNCNNQNTQMNGGQPPEMPSGQQGENGQPPEKPSDNNSQNSNTQGNN
ncbi:MAG: hypothetical protein IKN87_03205 [Bacilli bacterium]|nr:hypothetical protein [Bacilli bacterium]